MTELDGNAIETIQRLVESGLEPIEIEGIHYDPRKLVPVQTPRTEPLKLRTLNALAGYLKFEKSRGESLEDYVAQIVSPTEVRIVSRPDQALRNRDTYAIANAVTPDTGARFRNYLSQEEFLIWLQTDFVETESLSKLLATAGNVKSEGIATSRDDGVTQEATIKRGVASVERTEVVRRWSLAAWRTFREVDQPDGLYLFRMKQAGDGVLFALFPVVDAEWQLLAQKSISVELHRLWKDAELELPIVW